MELLAFRAETASEGVMLLAAVERDHLADQQFFIVSLFGKVFRVVFDILFLLTKQKPAERRNSYTLPVSLSEQTSFVKFPLYHAARSAPSLRQAA